MSVIHGDCIEVMCAMPEDNIHAIVTDPPYGLGFMGKAWDDLPPGQEWAEQCLRVLKPGGFLLAFGGTRTWHRLAVAVEDAGFEIRDSIAWMYGSGFPKHRANLKPAFEPIVMARKPYKGSLTANEAQHGTGALNIDACRIEAHSNDDVFRARIGGFSDSPIYGTGEVGLMQAPDGGRWPANVVLDDAAAEELDGQSGTLTSSLRGKDDKTPATNKVYGDLIHSTANPGNTYGDSGGASRFFYVAKAPKSERPNMDGIAHPTVKPLKLMRWLVRLVTPAGGTVLDPFAGSGTTIEAALLEGFNVIGIEREADYLPLIQARINRTDSEEKP